MRGARRTPFLAVLILVVAIFPLTFTASVWAQGITIDGNFGDWAGKASHIDPGGADDFKHPARSDITEYRAYAESGGLYLLMAWDNTAFHGGNKVRVAVTISRTTGNPYRVHATGEGDPGSVPLANLRVTQCDDAACSSETSVCTGNACTGANIASNTTWTDPWAGRASPDCYSGSSSSCGNYDLAAEMFIPWSLIGGMPGDGEFVFLSYNSYPSASGNAPDDTTGPNGIACRNTGGTFNCYESTPTRITLSSVSATLSASPSVIVGCIAILLVLGGGLIWGWRR